MKYLFLKLSNVNDILNSNLLLGHNSYLNRREMTTAFDFFCTSYIASSKSDINRIGEILFGVCGSLLGLYFIFCLFFIVIMRNHLLQFNQLVKFTTLPKDETGKFYHQLEKEMTDPFRENSSRVTPSIVFTLLTIMTMLFVFASSICLLMEFYSNDIKTSSTMNTVNLLNTVMRTSMRVTFRLLEMVRKSNLMLLPWNVVRDDNAEELINCILCWKEIVVGGNETNYKSPVKGLSSEIDSLLVGNSLTICQKLLNTTTTNTTTTLNDSVNNNNISLNDTLTLTHIKYDCLGMDKLVTSFIDTSTEYNHYFYNGFYDQQTALRFFVYILMTFTFWLFHSLRNFLNLFLPM